MREVIIIVYDMPYGSPDEAVKILMLRSALQRQNLPVKFIKLSQNCNLIVPRRNGLYSNIRREKCLLCKMWRAHLKCSQCYSRYYSRILNLRTITQRRRHKRNGVHVLI